MYSGVSRTDSLGVKSNWFYFFSFADLGVVGKPVQARLSAKDKERMDEQRVMASLQNEGLIQRPMSRATGGFAFEIVMDKPADSAGGYLFPPIEKKPPARLAKLEKRKKRKKKMTLADIEAKLEQAEERRRVSCCMPKGFLTYL